MSIIEAAMKKSIKERTHKTTPYFKLYSYSPVLKSLLLQILLSPKTKDEIFEYFLDSEKMSVNLTLGYLIRIGEVLPLYVDIQNNDALRYKTIALF